MSLFSRLSSTYPVMFAIEDSFESGNIGDALEQLQELLRGESAVPVEGCFDILGFIQTIVPDVPRPRISDAALGYSSIAHDIIALTKRHGADDLQSAAETRAYRWHEACGEFRKARKMIAPMMRRAEKDGDLGLLALLTNNHAYNYLVEGKPAKAEPLFCKALDIFEKADRQYEFANCRANILTSRFAILPFAESERLLPELAETHRALLGRGRPDWRVRKTMRIYAERAERCGRLPVAVAWAGRAANVARNVPTQLHQDDKDYVTTLERQLGRRSTFGRHASARRIFRNSASANRLETVTRRSSKIKLVKDSLMGVETEYSFTPFGLDGDALDRTVYSQRLVSLAARHCPSLFGRDEHDLFLANGARIYVDAGVGLINVEYSTPECTSPEELIAHTRAGDRLLARLALDLEHKNSKLKRAFISKCNFDYSGHTSGSHENYSHTAPQRELAPQLIPHLVSRVIYTGGGGFDDSVPNVAFMLSPRVRFLEHVRSSGAQSDRAIFMTKQESLSKSEYGRLHLLCGEGVRYDTAEYLRFGVTALLVKLVDAGIALVDDIEIKPLHAINIVARDIACNKIIGAVKGVPATAIDVQRHYLTQVRAHIGRPYLPDWADSLCKRWAATLDGLEAEPMELVGVLDWPTELGLYRSFVENRGLDWQRLTHEVPESEREIRTELFEFDVRFGDISDEGIFASLANGIRPEHTLVSGSVIDDALRMPPQGSRAKLRGDSIAVCSTSKNRTKMECNWAYIHDNKACRTLPFDDPFDSSPVKWSANGKLSLPDFETFPL